MQKESKIFVAGHKGLVGQAISSKLEQCGYSNIITKSHSELDLTRQTEVEEFFQIEKPEYVILAAAKVGGIVANMTYPADFAYVNLMIQNNIIHSSYITGVKKLLFLGSSCIYPRETKQPIKEDYLLTGELEPTNEAYAIAKIAGLRMCNYYNKQYGTKFISMMPTNIYGKYDNFDLKNSHVLPALIRKIHEAKINQLEEVEIWGTGNPRREFLYSDDLADACVFLLNNYDGDEFFNVGTGKDISIKELAEIICDVIEYKGKLQFDISKPDGMFQKKLDISKLSNFGWEYKTEMKKGIKETYDWFVESYNIIRK